MPIRRKQIFAVFHGEGREAQFLGIQSAKSPEQACSFFVIHLHGDGSSGSSFGFTARPATKKQIGSVCPMCRRNNAANPGKLCRLCKPLRKMTIASAVAIAKARAPKDPAKTAPAP